GDREVLQAALGLSAPQAFGGDFDGAKGVGLDARGLIHDTVLQVEKERRLRALGLKFDRGGSARSRGRQATTCGAARGRVAAPAAIERLGSALFRAWSRPAAPA